MADPIAFDLVSPERLLLSVEAQMVTIPGTDGYMGVLRGHEPVITTLRAGMIDVLGLDSSNSRYFIRGGFADVSADKVTVLAEEAIPMSEMDIEILNQRIKDAEEDLAAAPNEVARHKAAESLENLRMVRAAF
ncbi:MAG TPA: F0F1 ATP synthase subunit epsilon [Rhizomicrobium sp.]|jgi:F-type H+-transporting ATPase subunit epsilon